MSPNPPLPTPETIDRLLESEDFPVVDANKIKEKARQLNAGLVVGGALAGGTVAGPVGAAAGTAITYQYAFDEDGLEKLLNDIRGLLGGNWRDIVGMSREWQDSMEVANSYADELQRAKIRLEAYWEGPAHDAFVAYVDDVIEVLRHTVEKLNAVSENLLSALTIVFNAYAKMVKMIIDTAARLVGEAAPWDWAKQISNFITLAGDAWDFAVSTFGTAMSEAEGLRGIEKGLRKMIGVTDEATDTGRWKVERYR